MTGGQGQPERYSLPDGHMTNSTKLYVSAWRGIGERLGARLNAKLIAFDPDFEFQRNDTGRTFELPRDVALMLNAEGGTPAPRPGGRR